MRFWRDVGEAFTEALRADRRRDRLERVFDELIRVLAADVARRRGLA